VGIRKNHKILRFKVSFFAILNIKRMELKGSVRAIQILSRKHFTKVNIYLSLILQRLLNKGALLHNLVAIKLEPLFLYKNQHH